MFKAWVVNFLIFFLFQLSSSTYASTSNFCKNKFSGDRPELIEVEIDKYRNWQTNNLKNITDKSPEILLKYKKKFKATLHINFNGKIKCSFRAKIRQNGDHKDHIQFLNGNFIQSIDVELLNGHINGITNFKLFIPETRGPQCKKCFHDEIILTEIMRRIGFISPRTSLIRVKLNNQVTEMIFQEKTEKELLEFHKRREGPILEGDERYMWTFYYYKTKEQKKRPREDFIKTQLAKQINVNWAMKGDQYQSISHAALTKLNRIYLRYADQLQYSFYYNFTLINLDHSLLALNNPKQILEWEVYAAIILSSSRGHALAPHNRKFYWNTITNYFEPIYYDGDLNIENRYPHMEIPPTIFSLQSLKIAKKRIRSIEIENLLNTIKLNGLNISKTNLENKVNNIIKNISNLEETVKKNENVKKINVNIPKNYDLSKLEISEEKLKILQKKDDHYVRIKPNNTPFAKKIWQNYIETSLKIEPDINFIFRNPSSKIFTSCSGKYLECTKITLTKKDIENLLKGRLKKNNVIYQYVGEYIDYNKLKKIPTQDYKNIKIKNSIFYFDDDINFTFDEKNSILNIYQLVPGAKAFFDEGSIENIKINFYGFDGEVNSKISNFPIDKRGLTGCLSFVNLKLKNVIIISEKSSCEDAINLINVKGSINNINIKNSFSDGLDADFSDIAIDKINILSSGNDCVDLSYGKYDLNKLNLNNCGDKALSVGEKSSLNLNEIVAENSNFGVVSKDSSTVKLNNAYLKNLKICVSAYNKKQEFSGGFLKIKNIDCKNYTEKKDIDVKSSIIIENEL